MAQQRTTLRRVRKEILTQGVSNYILDLGFVEIRYLHLLYAKPIHDKKEHSDWFPERSEFCNTSLKRKASAFCQSKS